MKQNCHTQTAVEQSVQRAPDVGDCLVGVRTSQAVSLALSFFWLDGFAVPAPAQVPTGKSQNIGKPLAKHRK